MLPRTGEFLEFAAGELFRVLEGKGTEKIPTRNECCFLRSVRLVPLTKEMVFVNVPEGSVVRREQWVFLVEEGT